MMAMGTAKVWGVLIAGVVAVATAGCAERVDRSQLEATERELRDAERALEEAEAEAERREAEEELRRAQDEHRRRLDER